MGSSLLWVLYFDNDTKVWSVYDPSGTFDHKPILPYLDSDHQFGELAYMVPGASCLVAISQEVTFRGVTLQDGIFDIIWPDP